MARAFFLKGPIRGLLGTTVSWKVNVLKAVAASGRNSSALHPHSEETRLSGQEEAAGSPCIVNNKCRPDTGRIWKPFSKRLQGTSFLCEPGAILHA